MSEEINHPDRYAGGKYECIEVMIDIFGVEFVKNFCVLNAFKYLWRHKQKGGTEDIKKAVWYLNEYIELDEAVPAVMVNKPVKTVGEALDEVYDEPENADVSEKKTPKDLVPVGSLENGFHYEFIYDAGTLEKKAVKVQDTSDVEYNPNFHFETYYDKELGIKLPIRVYDKPKREKDISDMWSDGTMSL